MSIKQWTKQSLHLTVLQDSLIANLLRLIQKMKPKPNQKHTVETKSMKDMSDMEIKKKLFPGLALANEAKEMSPEMSPVKVRSY